MKLYENDPFKRMWAKRIYLHVKKHGKVALSSLQYKMRERGLCKNSTAAIVRELSKINALAFEETNNSIFVCIGELGRAA